MKDIYIVSAKRTAVASFLGSFSSISAQMLGSHILRAIVQENSLNPNDIDEVIMGQVLTGGSGQNPARQAVIHAGFGNSIPAMTINKVCGSGLKSVAIAASEIMSGNADMIIAGGQENMSLAMHAALIRSGKKFGDMSMIDMMMQDGLTDAFSNKPMGITAENIANKFSIGRREQDEYALNSQIKAFKAQQEGRFKDEILPIKVKKGKEEILFADDEGIRGNSTMESLAKLKPAFDPDGTVTAGNSSTINDGAAGLLVVSEEAIKKYNLTPLVRIASYACAGVDPSIMGTGPVPASRAALVKAGWKTSDLELIEANEAFAVQALYVNKNMEFDPSKINVNGGAIAIGHPIGASGARIAVTLIHEMLKRKSKKGLATLCIGGGMGIAMCFENVRN